MNIGKQLEKDCLLSCSIYPENLLIIENKKGIFSLMSCDSKEITIKEFIPISKLSFFRRLKIKRRNNRLLKMYSKIFTF